MGRSFYDVSHGALPNGGGFTTPEWNRAQSNIITAGNQLEVAVSSALAAATGSVAGTMASGTVATLSATYASLTSSIY